jgi:hypothetical protein
MQAKTGDTKISLDDFSNLFCYGMPSKLLIRFSIYLKFGLTYKLDNFNYSNLTARKKLQNSNLQKTNGYLQLFENNYFLYSDSLKGVEIVTRANHEYRPIDKCPGELIHYLYSSDKENEALNAAIEFVIKEKINSSFCFHNIKMKFVDYKFVPINKQITMENKTRKDWEIVQSTYVLAKNAFGQKHLNLHVSKRQPILKIAKELVQDIKKIYHYLMKDNSYYIPAHEHYTILKEIEEYEVSQSVAEQPPDIYVPIVKKTEPLANIVVPGKGELWNVRDQEIDQDKLEEFAQERGVKSLRMLREFIEILLECKVTKGVPKGMDYLTLTQLWFLMGMEKDDVNLRNENEKMWEYYGIVMNLIKKVLKPKDLTFPRDFLRTLYDVPFKEFNEHLKNFDNTLKGKALKSKLNTLKLDVLKMKREENPPDDVVEYTAVKQPITYVTKIVKKTRVKVSKKLIKKNVIQSEKKHQDFIKHEMPPEMAILLRNAKHRFTLFRKSKNYANCDFPKLHHLRNCMSALRNSSKKLRYCIKEKIIHFDKARYDLAVKRKREANSRFYQSYLEFKSYMDEKKIKEKGLLFSKLDPDFQIYDFREVNLMKMKLLIGGVCWSRDKLKCVGKWENRKLIFEGVLKLM